MKLSGKLWGLESSEHTWEDRHSFLFSWKFKIPRSLDFVKSQDIPNRNGANSASTHPKPHRKTSRKTRLQDGFKVNTGVIRAALRLGQTVAVNYSKLHWNNSVCVYISLSVHMCTASPPVRRSHTVIRSDSLRRVISIIHAAVAAEGVRKNVLNTLPLYRGECTIC